MSRKQKLVLLIATLAASYCCLDHPELKEVLTDVIVALLSAGLGF